MTGSRERQAGWGAIGMIISMLIVLFLLMIYLKGSGSESAKGGPPTAALEATKQRAHEFEEQQKKHLEDVQKQLAE
jgi:hypothetical protein